MKSQRPKQRQPAPLELLEIVILDKSSSRPTIRELLPRRELAPDCDGQRGLRYERAVKPKR